jgi:hypothetical protein
MQEEKKKKLFSRKLLISLLIFIVSYILFLMLWLNIVDYYGKGVLNIASNTTALVKNVDFEKIKVKKNGQLGAQFLIRHKKGVRIIINFDFSTITFNAPLTFAIMATLCLFIKNRKRAYSEALLILFLIHFLYVFTSETGRLSYIMAKNHLETASEFQLFVWQYLWGFIDSMIIRFEPFLIGFYIYLRFSSSPFKAKR